MTFEQFAQRLAERGQHRLLFEQAAALARDRWSDIGEVPNTGDSMAAMGYVIGALRTTGDMFNFGRLVLYAGYLAEKGAPTSEVALVVARRLGKYLSLAAIAVEGTDGRDLMQVAVDVSKVNPSAASAILIIDGAVPGAMQLLVRERDALRIVRNDPNLLTNARIIAGFAKIAYFLVELLESSDMQKIIVLQPSRKKGFEIVADYVRNGFHLFTLLEAALIGNFIVGPAVPPEEVAIARGERPLDQKRDFRARFDYFNWSAWGPTGFLNDAPTRWIWGELPLRLIPRVDGSPVILIEEPRYVRVWDGSLISRVHPDVRSSVVVTRELPESEVARWLEIFASASPAVRDQMKYAGVAQ